jgi:N,N'-diacetyllegionaminate synthase
MLNNFKIGKKYIGKNYPSYIIAEGGVNHNGKIELAIKLIDKAKSIGADAIKFQTFSAEKLVTVNAKKAKYQLRMQDKNTSQFKMLKKLELNGEKFFLLNNYCKKKKIEFLSTPYSFEDVDLLVKLKISAIKTSSMHLPETPFINYVSKFKLPLLVSTGMSNMNEVDQAVQAVRKSGNKKLILMQCTSAYPSRLEDSNLNVLKTYESKYQCLTGYSDHTLGKTSSFVAVSFGAKIIEKHFTLDNLMKGPDHKASLNVNDFKDFIVNIKNVEKVIGSFKKNISKDELEMRKKMRRSIVLNKRLKRGTILKEEDLEFKRPGYGLSPKFISRLVGKKLKRSLQKDDLILIKNVY